MTRALLVVVVVGCGSTAEPVADDERVALPPEQVPLPEPDAVEEVRAPGPVPETWVEQRVADARERLEATEAGREVWAAVEAHGGLATWLGAGTLEFEFDYAPVGEGVRRHTFERVDLWSSRAVHEEIGGDDAQARFGWDGEQAWVAPNAEAFSGNARFWALTPYYFVGMPFVVADPGAKHELLEDAELDGERYRIVKVTYEDGTGDAPDDYYVLYLDPETHRLAALRYVVSYPGFFAPGEHSPEKIMRYSEYAEVGGLLLAGRLDTSRWDPESGPGDVVTQITVTRVGVGETYAPDLFDMPADAEVSELTPTE